MVISFFINVWEYTILYVYIYIDKVFNIWQSAFNGPLLLKRKGCFIGRINNSAPSPHHLDPRTLSLSLSYTYIHKLNKTIWTESHGSKHSPMPNYSYISYAALPIPICQPSKPLNHLLKTIPSLSISMIPLLPRLWFWRFLVALRQSLFPSLSYYSFMDTAPSFSRMEPPPTLSLTLSPRIFLPTGKH